MCTSRVFPWRLRSITACAVDHAGREVKGWVAEVRINCHGWWWVRCRRVFFRSDAWTAQTMRGTDASGALARGWKKQAVAHCGSNVDFHQFHKGDWCREASVAVESLGKKVPTCRAHGSNGSIMDGMWEYFVRCKSNQANVGCVKVAEDFDSESD